MLAVLLSSVKDGPWSPSNCRTAAACRPGSTEPHAARPDGGCQALASRSSLGGSPPVGIEVPAHSFQASREVSFASHAEIGGSATDTDVEEAVVKGLGERGGSFATTVTDIVELALKPLKVDVSRLSDRLIERDAAAEVVQRLQPWAKAVGATVEHVGADNQPGDVVVRFARTSIAGRALTVVVEARDRADAKGLKRVTADLETAMRQRQATAAVYVGRTPAAFAKEIGEWTDGRGESGPFIACVDGSLDLAMRFIVALIRLDDMHQAHHELDATAIQPYVGQIRTSMDRVRSVKTKLTAIDNAAGDIRSDVESLRSEVLNTLEAVEGLLRKNATDDPAIAVHAA